MAGEIRRIHLDLAGDIGFRDFEPGDLIMAKQRMGSGYYTAEARVFAVGEDWIQVQCHNDFPAVDRLDWVRVGNDTDPNRRAFIRLAGSGEGSPRQEFRARIAEFEDLKKIDTLVMLEGNLDGVQHPVMGKLEGDGVLCSNLYAVGQMWVKVGDELKEAGAEFKVQADQIQSKVSRKDFDTLSGTVKAHGTAITQTAKAIELKAESSEVDALGNRITTAEASIRVNSEQIALRVTEGQMNSAINVQASAIMLSVSDHLGDVGIKISGADKGVHVKANLFDVTGTDGTKIFSASSDGNWVAMDRIQMGGFTIGKMSGGGNQFVYSKDGDVIRFMPEMFMSTATGQLNVVAYFETPVSETNRAIYVKGITEMYGRLDISTSLGKLSTNGNMLVMQSTSGGNIAVQLKNLPSGWTGDAHIRALPSGSVFIDSGTNQDGSCILKIKL